MYVAVNGKVSGGGECVCGAGREKLEILCGRLFDTRALKIKSRERWKNGGKIDAENPAANAGTLKMIRTTTQNAPRICYMRTTRNMADVVWCTPPNYNTCAYVASCVRRLKADRSRAYYLRFQPLQNHQVLVLYAQDTRLLCSVLSRKHRRCLL